MAILVRRSNLLVPVTTADLVREAWRHNADAITLDLEDGVDAARKPGARALVKDAIAPSARAGAEVFVRVNKPFLHADLDASIWPGVRGIVLPQVESAADVLEAAEAVTVLERQRGIVVGSL
jgi:citrate lyase subunit beta/citryl-CoA lyase